MWSNGLGSRDRVALRCTLLRRFSFGFFHARTHFQTCSVSNPSHPQRHELTNTAIELCLESTLSLPAK